MHLMAPATHKQPLILPHNIAFMPVDPANEVFFGEPFFIKGGAGDAALDARHLFHERDGLGAAGIYRLIGMLVNGGP